MTIPSPPPAKWSECLLAVFLLLACLGCGGGGGTQSNHPQFPKQPQLGLDHSKLDFGTVKVGGTKDMSLTIANSAPPGSADMTVTQIVANGSGFSVTTPQLPLTLSPGQSVTVTTNFAPQAPGSASGSLGISVQSMSATSVPLSGDAVAGAGHLVANPTGLAFGDVQVGKTSSNFETISNTGESTVTLSQANTNNAAYSYSGLSLPASLATNQSITFTVTFAPVAVGAANGTLSLVSDADDSPTTVSLSGTGTAQGQLGASPSTLNFGSVVVGNHAALTGKLTATGQTVTVSSVSSSDAEFAVSGISFPLAISAGQSAQYTVTFTPSAAGTAAGTLNFSSDAANSPTQQSVTGEGTAPPQHSVELSWNASVSPDVVGYNLYRGQKPGGPYSIVNGALDATVNYQDSSVQAGQTYYYVVTAVDSGGAESGYSNESKAIVPSP